MKELVFIIEDDLEGGFTAKAVGHSIFTDGNNRDELVANIKEAVGIHFDSGEMPKIIRLHFQREEFLAYG